MKLGINIVRNSELCTFPLLTTQAKYSSLTTEAIAMAIRRGTLHETRGKERLGYVYASPLCDMDTCGRKHEMELLDTAQVGEGGDRLIEVLFLFFVPYSQ